MKIAICRPADLGKTEFDLWKQFQHDNSSFHNAFLSPDFARLAAKWDPKIQLAVVEDNTGIAAFFAYEKHGRVGRALCYGKADAQAVIHRPGADLDGRTLLDACGIDIWEFDHLIADQRDLFAPQQVEVRASPTVDLSHGYENWLGTRVSANAAQFRKIRQRERKFANEQGSLTFEFDSRDLKNLDQLMAWKSAQYRRTGRRDRFANPAFEGLIRDVLDCRSESFAANLSVLRCNDKVVSVYLTLSSNGVISGWLPAYDVAYSKYGVGLIHRLRFLEAAASHGFHTYDFGAGDEDYKQALCSGQYLVLKGAVYKPSVTAFARRLRMAPVDIATRFVLTHPPLRRMARHTLAYFGSLRGGA